MGSFYVPNFDWRKETQLIYRDDKPQELQYFVESNESKLLGYTFYAYFVREFFHGMAYFAEVTLTIKNSEGEVVHKVNRLYEKGTSYQTKTIYHFDAALARQWARSWLQKNWKSGYKLGEL